MNLRKITSLALAFTALSGFSLLGAADLAGHWTSEFDTQIGLQKYAYDFKVEDGTFTGKATYEHSMGKGETALTDIKCTGDDVSFKETLKLDGNEIVIAYSGKISGDELQLTRQVGEFATEQVVAKRAATPAPAAKPADAK